jgi:hypothetical protein
MRRNTKWQGVRFVRPGLPALLLAGFALVSPHVNAEWITYAVDNYPSLQNGYTVSGTITTNGATGTGLFASDITSWNITITSGSSTIETFTNTNSSNAGANFDATLTTLSVTASTGVDVLSFLSNGSYGFIEWFGVGFAPFYEAQNPEGTYFWSSPYDAQSQPVASAVPEPSSAILAVLGAVAVVAYGVSRQPAFWRVRGSQGWITRTEWVSDCA